MSADRWHSLDKDRPLAHFDDEASEVILDFGKHCGRSLPEVPVAYLRWLLSRAGQAFMPAPLLVHVQAEAEERQTGGRQADAAPRAFDVPDWPDARDVPGIIDWVDAAPAGEVSEYRVHLLNIAAAMNRRLDGRAEQLLATLLPAEEAQA